MYNKLLTGKITRCAPNFPVSKVLAARVIHEQ